MTAAATEDYLSEETEKSTLRVLVGDDQVDVLEALRLLLKGAGHHTEMVDSPQAVLRAAKARQFDLILMDLNYARDTTSGKEGLDLLDSLQAEEAIPPVIVMTAWGNVELAVEAMRRGACDFVQKPWDNARLLGMVEKQAMQAARRRRAERNKSRAGQSEREIARNVQQKLFPQKTKSLATIDYAGHCVPASEVGGDYYDFLDLGQGRMGFVLGDVSGKGIAAALLMANLQASFRSQAHLALDHVPTLLRSVNRLFFDSTPAEHYATLFFGQYDDSTRRLRYVNCGHLAPILLRASGGVERLDSTATVLGLFTDWSCEEGEVSIGPGDTLVLFSDGVVEAGVDTKPEEFGEERLTSLLRECGSAPIETVITSVIEAVHGFSPASQHDDITVVGIRGV